MLAPSSTLYCADSAPPTRPFEKRGVNVNEQLTLFETTPVAEATPVWDTLSVEERAAVLRMLARLMARAVADLHVGTANAPEDGRE
jgi:hypothetical protein